MKPWVWIGLVGLLLVIAAGAAALGQDFFGGGRAIEMNDNVPYDGRITFVRLRYADFSGFGRRREPPWHHDYPTADTHMMKILNELTLARPRMDGSNILALSERELHNYPIAYMSEPGFWAVDDEEAAGLRAYLLKGGFIIFDDFRAGDWINLQEQMRHVLPDAQWIEVDRSQPVFHSFFEIDDPHSMIPPYGGLEPAFYGIFEQNDTSKRLMAIANVNNDIGEYWEFSDTGYAPVDLSNEAYKFGVNYFIYALTH
jgi:Domain of unknown function (DUF4159)